MGFRRSARDDDGADAEPSCLGISVAATASASKKKLKKHSADVCALIIRGA